MVTILTESGEHAVAGAEALGEALWCLAKDAEARAGTQDPRWGLYSASPFAGWPFRRNVLGSSPSPQTLNVSFAETSSGSQVVDLSALVWPQSRLVITLVLHLLRLLPLSSAATASSPLRTWPCASSSPLPANGAPPEAPPGRPSVLGRPGQTLGRLAAGAGHRLARHRPAVCFLAASIATGANRQFPQAGLAPARALHLFTARRIDRANRGAAPYPRRPGVRLSLTMSATWRPSGGTRRT